MTVSSDSAQWSFPVPGGEREYGELVQRRWRRDTLRELYVGADGVVTKRYWVRPGAHRTMRPWLREHRALQRLEGLNVPPSFGYMERRCRGGLEVVFRRGYIEGTPLETVGMPEAEKIAEILAEIHNRGVVIDDAVADNFVLDAEGGMWAIDFGKAVCLNRRGLLFLVKIGLELQRLQRMVLTGKESWTRFLAVYRRLLDVSRGAFVVIRMSHHVEAVSRWMRKSSSAARFAGGLLDRVVRGRRQSVKRRRFGRGRYVVFTRERAADIQEFITSKAFLHLPDSARVGTHNRRYGVYAFDLKNVGPVMLKVSRVNTEYPWHRRLNVWLSQWLRDYGIAASLGAFELARVGVNTIRPLATWTFRPRVFFREHYFLYARVEATANCRELLADGQASALPDGPERNRLVAELGRVIGRMHENGLRHGDVALGNFLVAGGDDPADGPRVIVIDTDHVRVRLFPIRSLKTMTTFYDLRRLRLGPKDMRRFFEQYPATRDVEKWVSLHADLSRDKLGWARRLWIPFKVAWMSR